MTGRIYLDHAATTPLLPAARAGHGCEAFAAWANPSSPHAQGRAAKALLEDARAQIKVTLGWAGELVFTSGASEALAIALSRGKAELVRASATEHDAVLRHVPAGQRLPVDMAGIVQLPDEIVPGTMFAIQQVNSETGVIQPLDDLANVIHAAGGILLADCSQGAGKLALPHDADMIVVSAHKLGGPIGIGALLVARSCAAFAHWRTGARLSCRNRGHAAGIGLCGRFGSFRVNGSPTRPMAQRDRRGHCHRPVAKWLLQHLPRLATIGSYRMPGSERAGPTHSLRYGRNRRFGGQCLLVGHAQGGGVLTAMGWPEEHAAEVIRVSLGHSTQESDIQAFLAQWLALYSGQVDHDLSGLSGDHSARAGSGSRHDDEPWLITAIQTALIASAALPPLTSSWRETGVKAALGKTDGTPGLYIRRDRSAQHRHCRRRAHRAAGAPPCHHAGDRASCRAGNGPGAAPRRL